MRKTIATLCLVGVLGLTAVALRGGDPRADVADTAFFRLRVAYSTTSDHSALELLDPTSVLTMRPMGTTGDPAWTQEDVSRLALNQPFEQAIGGHEVGMTVDYAVAPETRARGLRFHLGQGSLNASSVRASVLIDDGAGGFGERVLQEVVATTAAGNVGDLTIDLSGLTDADLLHRDVFAEAPPRQLWALYYGWFGADSWDSPTLLDRPLHRYASNSPADVAVQLTQAHTAGIDGLLASWWGPGHYTDETFPLVLDEAERQGMTAAIYLETVPSAGQALGEEDLYSWLKYALETYGEHPAYARVDGLPVVGIWAADRVPDDVWARVFDRLRADGLDALYMAGGAELGQLELFDAGYNYLPSESALEPRSEAVEAAAVRYYPLLSDQPGRRKLSVMTLNPGYDDHLLAGRVPNVIDREGGARYQRQADAALGANPDVVLITSWNEYYENTQIEPSELYGSKYVDLTSEFARQWKDLPGLPPVAASSSTTTSATTTPPPTTTPETAPTPPEAPPSSVEVPVTTSVPDPAAPAAPSSSTPGSPPTTTVAPSVAPVPTSPSTNALPETSATSSIRPKRGTTSDGACRSMRFGNRTWQLIRWFASFDTVDASRPTTCGSARQRLER